MEDFRGYGPKLSSAGTGPLWFIQRAAPLLLTYPIRLIFIFVLGLIIIDAIADLVLLVYEKRCMPLARIIGARTLEVRLSSRTSAVWKFDYENEPDELYRRLRLISASSAIYPDLAVNGGVVRFSPHKGQWLVRHESRGGERIYSTLLRGHELRALLRSCARLLQARDAFCVPLFALAHSEMRHTIYVPRDAPHPATQKAVSEALRIADWAAPYIRRRGDELLVWRVRAGDLGNARVLAAFESRGVTSLPALIAGKQALIGCSAIEGFYRGVISGAAEDNIEPAAELRIAPRNRGRPYLGPSAKSPAAAPRGVDNSSTDSVEFTGDDILAEFYGNEAAAFKGGTTDDYEFGTAVS